MDARSATTAAENAEDALVDTRTYHAVLLPDGSLDVMVTTASGRRRTLGNFESFNIPMARALLLDATEDAALAERLASRFARRGLPSAMARMEYSRSNVLAWLKTFMTEGDREALANGRNARRARNRSIAKNVG